MQDFRKSEYCWQNGRFVAWDGAMLHPASHGAMYGTGVFEGISCYKTPNGPALFRLGEHIQRLLGSARIMRMKVRHTKRQIEKACAAVVGKNGFDECYIRPMVSYGYGKIGLAPIGLKTDFTIVAWQQHDYLGKKAQEKGIRVKASGIRRIFGRQDFAGAKITGNYFNSALAKMEAIEAGFDEALMLDSEGFVCECAVENIFMARGGGLITPTTSSALPGITRASIIEIARNEGIRVQEKFFGPEELCAADEVFITGTSAEVTPVVQVDTQKIGDGAPGTITKKLQKIYFDAVRGKEKKYEKWLTYV